MDHRASEEKETDRSSQDDDISPCKRIGDQERVADANPGIGFCFVVDLSGGYEEGKIKRNPKVIKIGKV
ncbi:hypothetical protein BCE02nite_29770 [Brevibacillus centrosporus]|nr:hypothetical protein BCE02nite_29770 [Brevibacillus centrosporus]